MPINEESQPCFNKLSQLPDWGVTSRERLSFFPREKMTAQAHTVSVLEDRALLHKGHVSFFNQTPAQQGSGQ